MIEKVKGTIFNTGADLIVNTVNCDGIMGKGIALEFKLRYPGLFEEYKELCENGEIHVGKVYLHEVLGQKILSFPTKNHWRNPSKIEYIEEGLKDFARRYREFEIESVAFPGLGTSNGGLRWEVVFPLMEKYLSDLPIKVFICEDQSRAEGVEREMLTYLYRYVNQWELLEELSKRLRIRESVLIGIRDNFPKRFYQINDMKIVTKTSYEKLFKYLYSLCKNGTDALISKEKKETPVEKGISEQLTLFDDLNNL